MEGSPYLGEKIKVHSSIDKEEGNEEKGHSYLK
jgi:hypothetical protein